MTGVFLSSNTAKAHSFLDKGTIRLLFEDVGESGSDSSRIELKLSNRITRLLFGTELIYSMPYSETFAVNDDIGEIYGRDEQLKLVSAAEKDSVFLVEGAAGAGKKFFVKHAGKRLKINLIFANLREMPDEDLTLTANELSREMIIQRAGCCFIGLDEKNVRKAERIITSFVGKYTVFLCAEKNLDLKKIIPYRLRLGELSYEEKIKIWRQIANGKEAFSAVEKLAAAYNFGPSKIKKIISDCETAAQLQGTEVNEQLLEKVCLDASEGILKDKASRLITSFGGRGLSMLFEGSPGTGKTMAASIVANELGLPLFKVDLSKMMSKYIGETEKSLDEVFGIAEQNSAVLLFDETDALFGKRSEIKDSHDKYANVETSFLLQKKDEFNGIIVMTTNFKQNIDDAFMRRITYIIHFPAPDRECRLELWRNMFPSEAPLDKGVDLSFLAERFEMTGTMIRSRQ